MFSKTVGAGLAYSNGLRGSVSAGTVGYYTERTPELPQTVRFVVGIVKGGQPPELVRRFRTSILELRKDPRLVDKLYACKDRVHARLLAGYDAKGLGRSGGSDFVVGPDKQPGAWEQYLQGVEGPGPRLQRLYGRDFWIP